MIFCRDIDLLIINSISLLSKLLRRLRQTNNIIPNIKIILEDPELKAETVACFSIRNVEPNIIDMMKDVINVNNTPK